MASNVKLRWATGPVGGSWHTICEGMAALFAKNGLQLEVVPAGGRENPGLVDRAECHLGTTIDFVAAAAHLGRSPYDRPHANLRCIGGGWSPLPFHFAGAGRDRNRTLLGVLGTPAVRFGIPPVNTFDELTFRRVLAFAGTSYEGVRASGGDVVHHDYRMLPAAFARGEVDYFFGATSAPGEPVLRLSERPDGAVLLPIDSAVIEHLHSEYGYGAGKVLCSDYPLLTGHDLAAPVMDTVFLVGSQVEAPLVERLTSLLLQERGRLAQIHASLAAFEPGRSLATAPVPLHPGALQAFRRAGFEQTVSHPS